MFTLIIKSLMITEGERRGRKTGRKGRKRRRWEGCGYELAGAILFQDPFKANREVKIFEILSALYAHETCL